MTTSPRLAAALSDGDAVQPRQAGSVLVVQGREPWRVLMMRRPREADFAAGVYVFPGGSVHAEDGDLPDPVRGAALRELFEEVGILLARTASPAGRFARAADAERVRDALSVGLGFWAALEACDLEPAFDRLVFCTRWITPERVRRRFDTRFYVARLPGRQTIHPQPSEVVDWRWVTPEEAVSSSEVELIHATRRILELVGAEGDASRLVARLRRRGETAPVTPRIVDVADGHVQVVDDATTLFPSRR